MNYGSTEYTVDKWKRAAAWMMENLHPSLLMVVYLFFLHHAINTDTNPYITNWIRDELYNRFAILITRDTWTTVIGLGMVLIAFLRPDPRRTLFLSLPAGFYTLAAILFGISNGVSNPVLTMVIFTWLSVGVAVTAIVAAGVAASKNVALIEKLNALEAALNNEAAPKDE